MSDATDLQTFIPITELEGKTFIVQDYQRGYKWGNSEMTQLLEDIDKHNSQKGPYCLQPIIVKPVADKTYEVIDGQQRLTSLYLLMHYFNTSENAIKYKIEYKTREQSQLFLSSTLNLLEVMKFENWNDFITAYPAYNNVDIFHFFEVFTTIDGWFQSKDIKPFLNKVRESLYIIWYDVTKGNLGNGENLSAEKIFINFNANKVDLSSSELIKALFILDYEGTHTKEQKKHNAIELALEWDTIENKLQDNTFWYFICNNQKYNQSATRIDFLFDLISGEIKSEDKLGAYRKYENLIKSEFQKVQEWRKVKTCFYKLDEWYKDNHLYHKIGFLIASGLADIQSIIAKSEKSNKKDFYDFLTRKIYNEINKKKNDKHVYIIDDLSYDESKVECNWLLLLLNVFRYMKDNSNNKFPFNLYHEKNWSLEHVNPQNPEAFKDKAMLNEWVKSIETFVATNTTHNNDSLSTFGETINRLKEIIDDNLLIELLTKNQEYLDLISKVSDSINVHNITNLALLDRNTNSVLGNKPYLEKRDKVLEFDKKGTDEKGNLIYIPVCTRDLFTKTYSYLTDKNIGTYFTAKDMADYKSYMIDVLNEFLPKQNDTIEAL
jgi:hypothetical protein